MSEDEWTRSQGAVGHHQAYQHTQNGNPRAEEREGGAETILA